MIKGIFYKLASRTMLHPWYRLTRGMTLGVRVAAFDSGGRVLLIRHTYAPGWLFPGGGVERGETMRHAAARELDEEAGVIVKGPLSFHGLFLNEKNFRGDHVAVFISREFERRQWKPSLEIAEARFFEHGDIPADITSGTRRRLEEIAGRRPVEDLW